MLMTASVPSMIGQFNMNNIKILLDMGYEVHVATNFKDYSYWPKERVKAFIKKLKILRVKYHQIDYSRSPKNARRVMKSVMQMERLLETELFVFVHCHTPMAGVVSRICCHKNGVKVIYTAHGFHFYIGAPLWNWMVYYPIEKFLSKWTDVLITINKEDYERANKKFHAKKNVYVPGVGVDTGKYGTHDHGLDIRKELGLLEDNTMFLSVGELNKNKNHEIVIRALKGLPKNIVYVIVGKGELSDYLEKVAAEVDITDRVIFTGFRNDVAEFYAAANIYVLPSIREGLNVSLMEAMASGLPCVVGNIRGNKDLIDDEKGGYLFEPTSDKSVKFALKRILDIKNRDRLGIYNLNKIKKFDFERVENAISDIYGGICEITAEKSKNKKIRECH